jgi:hypothetical protein
MCPTSGAQLAADKGVHEALQFLGDCYGIVAGAPLFNNTHDAAANGWDYQAFNGPAKSPPARRRRSLPRL